jgi:hypothetical protein
LLGGIGVAGPATLVFLEHRHRTPVADATVDARLGSEDRLATPTAPPQMAAIACAKRGRYRPAGVGVRVRIRTTRRRDHHPSALRAYQLADEVIRKLVPRLPAHHDVTPPTADAVAGSH